MVLAPLGLVTLVELYIVHLRRRHVFVIEKYVEDVKQKQKDVLDLLESMMRPPGLVKEELRQFYSK